MPRTSGGKDPNPRDRTRDRDHRKGHTHGRDGKRAAPRHDRGRKRAAPDHKGKGDGHRKRAADQNRGRKNPEHQAKGGKDSTEEREDSRGESGRDGVTSALRRMWRKENRCLACGSEKHHIKDCSLGAQRDKSGPSTHNTGLKAAPAKAKDANPPSNDRDNDSKESKGVQHSNPFTPRERAEKRKRPVDMSPSGLTPPVKKGTNFSYATVTNSAICMVILTREGNHIAVREHNRLRTLVEERWINQLEKGENLVAVERWEYTSRTASVFLADAASVETVKEEANKLNLSLMNKEQYERERPVTKILSGLITGPAAKRDRKDLERFLKVEVERVKVPGFIKVYNVAPIARSGNALLRISVCAEAEARMKELDYQLRIGASGFTKFEDARASKKVERHKTLQERQEELHRLIEEDKKKIKQRMEELRDLEKAETESVGSMGMSAMEIDKRGPTNTADTAEPKSNDTDEELLRDTPERKAE